MHQTKMSFPHISGNDFIQEHDWDYILTDDAEKRRLLFNHKFGGMATQSGR